jgi:hypothetical protein
MFDESVEASIVEVIAALATEPPAAMENRPALADSVSTLAEEVEVSMDSTVRFPERSSVLWVTWALVLFSMVLTADAPPPLTERLKILALVAAEAAREVALIVASSRA